MESEVTSLFEESKIIYPGREEDAKETEWYEHPDFKGVFLKDLVKRADTGGQFSCHIVRIEKECEVGGHSHEVQWEFNEVIEGNGIFILGDKEIAFNPGFSFVTPPGVQHTVMADGTDLYLLAKFVPAI
jgi:quercetin dioxygenase-like cupin family protein